MIKSRRMIRWSTIGFIFILSMLIGHVSAQEPTADSGVLTATTKYTTTLWGGPGNISCYSNMGAVAGGETVTLLGYAPAQCYPSPNHDYYYIRRANGTEGWILDSILNLPWDVESLPILSAPPTATPTSTPSATLSAYPDVLTATIKYPTALWSGPGNISCYSNMGAVAGGETVTLLGYAPAQCYPYPNHIYYYIRRANGTEGWILDSILNLPWDVESLPILTPATFTPSPTATATRTPLPTATPTSTNMPVPPTATSTATSTNTLVPPTATSIPTSTNTPIPPTATPIPVTLKMELQVTTDNNQQSQFHYRLTNLSGQAQSGLSVRFYFTTDSGNAAVNYTLEKYWDQSGSAVISGPTLAGGDTYYFTISYAGALSASSTWEYAGALHLANWGSTYGSANDFWISGGSSGSYIETHTLPIFQSGLLVLGNMP